jgi:carboxylesterase type B
MKALIAMLFVFAASFASAADSDPTVAVTGGRVRGVMLEKGGAVFKGIPYAQPPVGDLLSDTMQQYRTNFAKTGDPNGKDLPVWPKFDASSRAYIQFTDSGSVAKEGLRRPYCDLFIENIKRRMAR